MNPGITSPTRTNAVAARPSVASPTAPATPLVLENDRNNPLRIFAFSLGLGLVFLRVSALHQVQTVLMSTNLKLLYVVGIPATLGAVLCGGLQRAFSRSTCWYWLGYWVWMAAACPTSVWRSNSVVKVVLPYMRTNLPVMLVIAGLVVGWKDCKSMMRWMAYGAFATLLVARLFQREDFTGRFALEFGTVSNSNDFACHLLFCLPFLYWVVLSSKSFALRVLCLGGIGYGILTIVKTGSRGGLIGLIIVILACFLWSPVMHRLALLALVPIGCAVSVALVPHDTLVRILSFSSSEQQTSAEALESSEQRKYLLRKSIEYTFRFPIFGVGPGDFAAYEGGHNQTVGAHGTWQATHNTFTEVSSECGIPALLFYVAGLVSSFRIFYSTYRKARSRPDCKDIRDAMFCTMLCMVGFIAATTFLNFAYQFYQVLLGGWAVAVATGTKEEFAKREAAAQPLAVPPMPPPRRNPWVRATPGVVY